MIKTVSASSVILLFLMISSVAAAQDLTAKKLVKALLQGGHYIYFRHAATDWSQSDNVVVAGDWRSCDRRRMRQLSKEGHLDAVRIGKAIRELGIPVSRILSSEYCRAVETAQEFGLGKVETTRDVMNMRAAPFVGGRVQVIARFRKLLAQSVPPGANVILVGHGNLLRDATSVYPQEGGSGIFAPDPAESNGFRFVAQLRPEDWAEMAKSLSTAP
jgi:broad specificity phosphatase PhoE